MAESTWRAPASLQRAVARKMPVIRETVGHLRDLPRYRQILSSLVRYGYQDVVAALHLEGIVRPFERAALGSDVPPQDRPRRLRLVCEDLGPTFVKLGQLLSTRPGPAAGGVYQRAGGAAGRCSAVLIRAGRDDFARGVQTAAHGGVCVDRRGACSLRVDLSGPSCGRSGGRVVALEGTAARDRQGGTGRP